MAELGDRLISHLVTKFANAFVVDDACWHLRDVLVNGLVLAVDALSLRCSGSALATKAHACGAAVVLELGRWWNARETMGSEVASAFALRIAVL